MTMFVSSDGCSPGVASTPRGAASGKPPKSLLWAGWWSLDALDGDGGGEAEGPLPAWPNETCWPPATPP